LKVKVFTASTMQEALAQVKNDLGRDAVILHTRRFRTGGFLGFFAKEKIEVMAAVDNPAPERRFPSAAVSNPSLAMPLPSMPDETKITALQLEISGVRKLVEQLLTKIPSSEKTDLPVLGTLLKNDVEPGIAENLVQGLKLDAKDEGTLLSIRQVVLDRISNHLGRVEGIKLSRTGCKTVALIGPTGVGKTTTIAKLAANFAVKEGIRVALVTADTYRIAAVEQLRTYAEIIGTPLEIVYTPDELKMALYRHRDKQLILIDTAGRSPRNDYQIAELQSLLSVDPYIEVYLVISTTTSYKDTLEIINRFSVCSPQKFLFTKLDEANSVGLILNLACKFPTALSYITNGQNVPDDIELLNSYKLANLILRD